MSLDRSIFQAVLSDADEADLDRLFDVIKQRRRILDQVRTVALKVGDTVRIGNITPASLKDCLGTVVSIRGKSATVKLDERSTEQVRWGRSTRVRVPEGVKEYELTGIPLSCLFPA